MFMAWPLPCSSLPSVTEITDVIYFRTVAKRSCLSPELRTQRFLEWLRCCLCRMVQCSMPVKALTEPTHRTLSVGRLLFEGHVFGTTKCCNISRRVGQGPAVVAWTVGWDREIDNGWGVGDHSQSALFVHFHWEKRNPATAIHFDWYPATQSTWIMPRPFGERYRFVIVLGLLFFKCDSEMQEFWCVTFNDDSDTDRTSRALLWEVTKRSYLQYSLNFNGTRKCIKHSLCVFCRPRRTNFALPPPRFLVSFSPHFSPLSTIF